jgi:hypothetical protein
MHPGKWCQRGFPREDEARRDAHFDVPGLVHISIYKAVRGIGFVHCDEKKGSSRVMRRQAPTGRPGITFQARRPDITVNGTGDSVFDMSLRPNRPLPLLNSLSRRYHGHIVRCRRLYARAGGPFLTPERPGRPVSPKSSRRWKLNVRVLRILNSLFIGIVPFLTCNATARCHRTGSFFHPILYSYLLARIRYHLVPYSLSYFIRIL